MNSGDEDLPAVHGVPCDHFAQFVAKDPTDAMYHHLQLQQMLVSPSRYELSDEGIIHIRSCFLSFSYLQIEYSNSD